MVIGAAIAGLVLGFIAGMATYQRSRRWCPVCGATLRCLTCSIRDGGPSQEWAAR